MVPARITDTAGEIRITRMSVIWAVVAALLSLSLMLSNAIKITSIKISSLLKPRKLSVFVDTS